MGRFADAVIALREQADHADRATCVTRVGNARYIVSYRGQSYVLPLTIAERLRDGDAVMVLVRRGVPIVILGSVG